MYRATNKYVRACHTCQTQKLPTTQPSGSLPPIPPATTPFQLVSIDLSSFPPSKRNHGWIIVAIEYMTRYAQTQAIPVATSEEVAEFFLKRILLRHGAPQFLLSDRGTPLPSKLLDQLLRLAKSVHNITTAYHPHTNGSKEKLNHTLASMISMYVNEDQSNLDVILPCVTYAYNTARQAATGYSRYFVLCVHHSLAALDTALSQTDNAALDPYVEEVLYRAEVARQLARLRTYQSQKDQQLRHSDTHSEATYNVGDEVLVWTPARHPGRSEKLLKKFTWPFKILHRVSSTN